MITTVVYTSNTGETEKYAKAFAEMVHLPCMDLKHSSDYAEGTSVLYFGWVFADHIQGYEKAQQRFHIPCVCGVGISTAGTKEETIREAMLMYGKEASNRKQEIDRQHYTIPNQRPKDKHCGKI